MRARSVTFNFGRAAIFEIGVGSHARAGRDFFSSIFRRKRTCWFACARERDLGLLPIGNISTVVLVRMRARGVTPTFSRISR